MKSQFSQFFEKINKIDKPLVKLTKGEMKRPNLNKIRDDKRDITTDTSEIQNIIKEYFGNLILQQTKKVKKKLISLSIYTTHQNCTKST
jgi:hypothetical protein